MPEKLEKSAGYDKLIEILSHAIEGGADAIEMEYDSGHTLEVMFRCGNSGSGFGLDGDEAGELIDSLWEEKRKGRGKFRATVAGKDYMVQVKTYDHFGDDAYRLTFREAKR